MNKTLIGFVSALALVSCAGTQHKTIELQSSADLAGLRVATISGSCYDLELSAREDVFLDLYNSEGDLLQALLNKKADVIVNDEVVYNTSVRKENGIKIAMLGEQSFPTAFLFSKKDTVLAKTLTAVQRRMEEDGTLQSLKDFWLTDRYAEAETFPRLSYEATGEPIRVATTSMTAPLAFMVEGEWYGLEVELLRHLGKELNRPLEIKLYGVASGCLSVKSGQADVLSGCVFVTEERKQDYQFSEPYHGFHPAYFVLDEDFQSNRESFLEGFKKSIWRNIIMENRWKFITDGLWETLKISFMAILLGSVLGMGLYAQARSRRRWMRSFARVYNSFMAGIPELVLLLIMFYVVFAKTGIPSDMVAIVTFALFFASGASDIYKTSLDAIPGGQTEAGLALGFTRTQTFFHIVLPQAIRRGLPLYRGQCVSLLKGTSIVGYIAIQDLTRAGDIIRSRTFDAVIPLLVVTVIYFVLVWLIGLLLHFASPKKKVL